MKYRSLRTAAMVLSVLFIPSAPPNAQGPKQQVIPHGQSAPPGPPLSPAEAIKKMQVPPGFHVELVAAEPDLVNPVAMTFDEKGRIWITESIEYPRHSAGPGKDRVKLFESTKGDGKYDKVTTVIEGLNIPSGIAVGHGGVWVANSPDILFYPFVDRDTPKLGKPQVVVTGFGRSDTHEVPNSLTWGPDGYLYGLNGVFNPSVVKQDGKEWRFTCAMFRIHPRTKKFDIFCEGTSNPWGIAFDGEGSAFVSACVIDHLWHLVETGYYHRQGGPYPPFTWKIESIVKHRHQKAAYCGLCWFDSDAYPPEYRGKLYMGNIHGNCINSDELTRDGSTYFGQPRPDFLTANDAWFMPVVQKVGPDGCLYILDWYDRYHCYQDAGRDPAGIDRLRGRLYRVVYGDYKPAGTFDLGKESDKQLLHRMHSPSIFYRDLGQRIMCERFSSNPASMLWENRFKFWQLVLDDGAPQTARMHAMWALLSTADAHDVYMIDAMLRSKDAHQRAGAVHAVGNLEKLQSRAAGAAKLAKDPSPDVQLQVAIAACKLKGIDPLTVLLQVLANAGNDKLIPHVVWQNLHPLLEERGEDFLRQVSAINLKSSPAVASLLPRAVERILGAGKLQVKTVVGLVTYLSESDRNTCAECLASLATKIQTGEVAGSLLDTLRTELQPTLRALSGGPNNALAMESTLLAATLKDSDGLKGARQYLSRPQEPESLRLKAVAALVTARDDGVLDAVAEVLNKAQGSAQFRGKVLAALGKLDQPRVADVVLASYAKMEPDLQPKAVDLLTERPAWSKQLLGEIARKKIATTALNVNQVRKLLATRDKEITKQVTAVWGTLREGRNPAREKVVAEMRDVIKKTPGDAQRGVLIFKKVCAQCHKIHGEGVDVGPDITSNGRSDFEQLLSNVFDPSLVIGAGYQATTVVTNAGQVLTGLVAEDSSQRVVLKVQGGELKTIPRSAIDEINVSKVSLMPEDLERQLQAQEIADLFAYLCLDRPPSDPKARKIPGTPR
jgi:putative membrane-bound dehydrogenase-like protein